MKSSEGSDRGGSGPQGSGAAGWTIFEGRAVSGKGKSRCKHHVGAAADGATVSSGGPPGRRRTHVRRASEAGGIGPWTRAIFGRFTATP